MRANDHGTLELPGHSGRGAPKWSDVLLTMSDPGYGLSSKGAFDLVLVISVVEHLPARNRRAHVDEHYGVLAPGGIL